jgi:dihydroceramidase
MFVYESSTVDWCETNYLISNYICEFQNSFSSFAYCLLTYYQYRTYKKYIVNNKLFFNLLFINNFLLGISSFLFHSTLSYMGQFLDEGFIVTFIFLINIIFSNNYYIVLELLLALSFPTYTRFMLFLIGTRHIYKVLYKDFSKDIISGLKLSLGFFIFSIVFWIIDLLFCNYLLFSIHWLWHIISAVALYNIVIVTIVYKHNNMKLINKYYINDIQTILSPSHDAFLL